MYILGIYGEGSNPSRLIFFNKEEFDMAENNLSLAYLPFASQSQEDSNGKPLVNGHIEVYLAGSTTKYITYNDFDGTHNEANIPLNSLGRATVLA